LIVAPNPNLGSQIYDEDLEEHLDEVVRLGELLGLSSEEIAHRLREARQRLDATRLTKELA
jgi:hypothetical protein